MTSDLYKQGMRRLGGAVNIVTTTWQGINAGLTATAVCSLSTEPPRLLTCVNRQGYAYEALTNSRIVCVNVLASHHKDLAMRFAGMLNNEESDRFSDPIWTTNKTGSPVLTDALVSFDCEISSILDTGSHGIVIGEVKGVRVSDGENLQPLFYAEGDWSTLQSLAP